MLYKLVESIIKEAEKRNRPRTLELTAQFWKEFIREEARISQKLQVYYYSCVNTAVLAVIDIQNHDKYMKQAKNRYRRIPKQKI